MIEDFWVGSFVPKHISLTCLVWLPGLSPLSEAPNRGAGCPRQSSSPAARQKNVRDMETLEGKVVRVACKGGFYRIYAGDMKRDTVGVVLM